MPNAFNALSQDGKLSYDDLGIAQEWVAAYEAKGELVDVEALIGEIEPILKQRMKHLAAREMIQRVGSGGATSKAAKMLEKADNLGNAGAERLVMRTYSPDMAAADPIKSLRKGYLVRGALHLLVSDEGMGKASMMRDLATRLAMGRELPGEDAESRDPESTLIVCPEDGPDHIAARLKDAGLDGDGWSRVHVAEGSGLCLPKDIADLEGKIRDTGASLVVIELHWLDKGSADKTDDVHRALDPLAFSQRAPVRRLSSFVTRTNSAPLSDAIVSPSSDLPPVWPDKDGKVRGEAFYPLYPSIPGAALKSPALYELLALYGAIRGGSQRERALAIKLLDERWSS